MLGYTEANVAITDLENEYEILGELGRGATAVVYRARDRELGREVAIKFIRPKYADDDSRALQQTMLSLLAEQLAAKRLTPSAGELPGYRPPRSPLTSR